MRKILGAIAWGLGAFAAFAYANNPAMALPVWLFWIGSGVLLVQYLRSRGRSPKRTSRMDGMVAVSVGVPRTPTPLVAAFNALPAHCRRLIGTTDPH